MAILIDLTGEETYINLWNYEMNEIEANYLNQRVFVRLIHA